ncbi:hypothetical protein [Peribacillus glennii]|uniref:Uncharacterized protein n=1 Tax=Peribacillus glennii TaxID=2303991 RepID=A0A372LDK3_9BACI|nr:hypothetical protein [Peribacillus glennii]RFU64134.1 hypothetical protein D0466_09400 [Peribacillus glennii]
MALFKAKKQVQKNDRFTQLMFGKKAAPQKEKTDWKNLANNIDYGQLMDNVEILMNAYGKIKPGLSKINPLVSKLIKKG